MQLAGAVSSGLGRAHKFMAQPHYQKQFKRVLGQTAWPGTLNVTVNGKSLACWIALRQASGMETSGVSSEIASMVEECDTTGITGHRINGFEREGRSFGGATAFLATIGRSDDSASKPLACAILIPDLTRHTDVVEVIAPAFLRESLNLLDGDQVSLTC